MYHFLRGRLVEFVPGRIILDVGGIGYEVEVPLSSVPVQRKGSELLLWTHLLLRDDSLQIFGFQERSERDLFRILLKVSGIGPRSALQILSGIKPQDLVQTLAAEDWKRLTLIPGIGPKTARRLLIELKEKLTDRELQLIPSSAGPTDPVLSQAFSALVHLGFAPEAVRVALKDFTKSEGRGEPISDNIEEIIKKALIKLAP
ncbi:MAG TPA: Holliday junction branch migration protein RuvA [bacterium]